MIASVFEKEIELISDVDATLDIGNSSWSGWLLMPTAQGGLRSGGIYSIHFDDGKTGLARLGQFTLGRGFPFSGHGALNS